MYLTFLSFFFRRRQKLTQHVLIINSLFVTKVCSNTRSNFSPGIHCITPSRRNYIHLDALYTARSGWGDGGIIIFPRKREVIKETIPSMKLSPLAGLLVKTTPTPALSNKPINSPSALVIFFSSSSPLPFTFHFTAPFSGVKFLLTVTYSSYSRAERVQTLFHWRLVSDIRGVNAQIWLSCRLAILHHTADGSRITSDGRPCRSS